MVDDLGTVDGRVGEVFRMTDTGEKEHEKQVDGNLRSRCAEEGSDHLARLDVVEWMALFTSSVSFDLCQ